MRSGSLTKILSLEMESIIGRENSLGYPDQAAISCS